MLVPPQGERVVRHLLDHYPKRFRWIELAHATQLDRGYTTRVLKRLEEAGLLSRERGKPVDLPYPAELFELWRSGSARVVETNWACAIRPDQIAQRLARHAGEDLVLTGVYAAGRLTGVLDAERVEAYVVDLRSARRLAKAVGAEPTERGANLVLLIHRDPAVISIGASETDGLRFASASQIYKDAVQRSRGRETEAAAALRRQRLRW
jgi:CRP-like cAMP-binding protein